MKGIEPATRIVVLTGYGSIATAVEAVKRGAVEVPDQTGRCRRRAGRVRSSRRCATAADPARAMSLDRVEWEHINRVLLECGGNISEAARHLGLHRRTLQRKLSKYPARE